MSATAPLAGIALVPRRSPRLPVAIPVDVTVLRSGVPDSIPGRSLDLGEGGLALILAGELHAGDPVAIEFRLPNLSSAVQAKAVVRHQAQLRCGLEFLSLSDEQQAMIRYWTAATSLPATAWLSTQTPEPKPKIADIPHASRRSLLAAAIIFTIIADMI